MLCLIADEIGQTLEGVLRVGYQVRDYHAPVQDWESDKDAIRYDYQTLRGGNLFAKYQSQCEVVDAWHLGVKRYSYALSVYECRYCAYVRFDMARYQLNYRHINRLTPFHEARLRFWWDYFREFCCELHLYETRKDKVLWHWKAT